MLINNGGPFWARTRDLSLIRNDYSAMPSHSDLISNTSMQVHHLNYIDIWCDEQRLAGIANITINGYRRKIEVLLSQYPMPTEFDIKQFLVKKQEFGACSGTVANYVKAYRSFFGYLHTRGLYDFDPGCLKLPKVRNKERRVPSDADIIKLLNTVDSDEDAIALLLLIDCGIRVHELASIKVSNINFDDSRIMIIGKGGKTRNVYLSEMTLNKLREYVKTCQSEYIFPSTRADAAIPYRCNRYFEKRLSELCEEAGVEHITPHQLRHYFATHTLSNGADVKAVSEILGHADVGITLKIYHHVNAKSIRQMHREYGPLGELEMVSRLLVS